MSKPCDLGMGCDEAGICYAIAHDRPEMCPVGQPEPCCMWCGAEKPESGWHFYCYPQALCSEKCSAAFKAAY